MSSNKSGCGCLSVLGLTSILLFGGWYTLQQGWLGKELTPIEAAKVIPDEAIVTSFINTRPKNWSQLPQLGLPETEKIIEDKLKTLKQELPESTAINYQKDLQPWLGGIMVAVLPEQVSAQEDGNILFVLGIKNKLKARNFINKLSQETQQDWQKSEYRGITITEGKTQNKETISSALLGNKLVLANDKITLQKAIDTYQGEPSLAEEPGVKKVLSQQLTLENSVAQVYFTDFDYLISAIAKEDISAAVLADLQQLESVVMGVGIQKTGIHIQSITNFKSNQNSSEISPTKSNILTKLPDSTIAAINGQNLSLIWSTAVKQLETDDDLRRLLDLGRLSFRYATTLDLDQDIFSWMDGEFALGLMTTDKMIIPGWRVGLEPTIILETSKPNKAKATLKKVEKSLPSNLGISSQQKKIANKQTITEWRAPQSDFLIAYGWVDKNHLVLTVGNSLFDSVGKSAKNPLNKSDQFKAIAKKLPKNNLGYFYLDVNQAMSIVNNLPTGSTNISPEAMAILNSWQGIGATATMTDQLTSQLDAWVLFK